MSSDHSPPGAGITSRLASRMERGDLSRTSVAGGGEVYSGRVATRALRALGARAMTLDRSIIVDEDFDMSKPEDAALYAHEQYHAEHGDGHGGGGGENFRDAEEIAARAAEAIAYRQAKGGVEAGGTPGAGPGSGSPHGGSDDAGGGVTPGGPASSAKADGNARTAPDPGKGYQALRDQGYTHFEVVDSLARKVINTMDDAEVVKNDRQGHLKGTL
jgi:hypothetical protein